MAGFAAFVRRHVPTRETIGHYRLLRPFARQLSQPNLWHLNHRSVPRAVALGLGVGVIIPFLHTFIAALLAIPLRANVAIAAATTLVINPGAVEQVSGELSRFLFWIHHASGPIALGIVTIAIAAALLGYGFTAVVWRVWLTSKWRARRHARRAAKR